MRATKRVQQQHLDFPGTYLPRPEYDRGDTVKLERQCAWLCDQSHGENRNGIPTKLRSLPAETAPCRPERV